MKFEKGDRVRIIEEFQKIRYAGDPGIVDQMLSYTGQEFIITNILSENTCLLEDNYWTWSNRWLEPIENKIEINENDIMDVF